MRRGLAAGGLHSLALISTLGLVATAGCLDGPRERFEREALPVLEGRCASARCHGVPSGEERPQSEGFFLPIEGGGVIGDVERAREESLRRVVTRSPPLLSSLLRVPLPGWEGGGPHAGGALFTDRQDPALRAVVRWIESEPEGAGGEDLELDALERLFGEEALPVLVERCGRGGCHGPTSVAFTAFPATPDPETGAFAPREVRAAHRAARRHLDLWGADPASSRLIRKAIGAEDGGLAHRGGPGTLFPEAPAGRPLEAPGIEALLRWARAEREALGVIEGQEPSGLLFVRGPASPRSPYRIEPGPLGSDLYLTGWPPSSASEENLSAALHTEGEAELRDPALSHDGRRVSFAMRRAAEERFSLWEIDLVSRMTRRVTPEGAEGSFVQPAYAPDGRLIAAWDGHGEAGADGEGVPPELVAIDGEGRVTRLTYTPAPEVWPAFLASGKTRGELVFGTRRVGPHGAEGVLFRFPLCHDPGLHGEPEYHVQHGASLAPEAPLVARDLPDGRQLLILLRSAEEGDDRGSLALLDRSMGPYLRPPVDGLSLAGYRSPVAFLDGARRFRDPAPLPDGRFLLAADREDASGEDALYLGALEEGEAGPRLASLELLMATPGASLRTPLPIFARPVEDDGHEAVTDPEQSHGFLTLRDVAVLESLYGRAEARGSRLPLREIAAVRLLAARPTQASELLRFPDGGTNFGLSDRIPSEILAEVDLPEDRSAWIRVPARRPMLLQWLDGDGRIVGRQLDRWYFAEGAESVPGGTNLATYAHACAGCHGSASGDPEEAAAPPPDAISSASVTLSTHEGRDRRRPLAPVEVDPEGALAIDFLGDLAEPLEERCATDRCHGGTAPAGGLPLDGREGEGRFGAAYEGLVRSIDLEGLRASRSPLIELLTGAELEAPGEVAGPHPEGGTDPALIDTIERWIEAGAFYDLGAR